jgi:hypothetical protein
MISPAANGCKHSFASAALAVRAGVDGACTSCELEAESAVPAQSLEMAFERVSRNVDYHSRRIDVRTFTAALEKSDGAPILDA